MEYNRLNENPQTVKEGYVPCKTYLCIEDNRLVGMVNIRYSLNEYCFNYSGNIGYSVRKSERKKGYATEILNLALTELKKKGINRVLMTCNKSNIASSKVIIKNGDTVTPYAELLDPTTGKLIPLTEQTEEQQKIFKEFIEKETTLSDPYKQLSTGSILNKTQADEANKEINGNPHG